MKNLDNWTFERLAHEPGSGSAHCYSVWDAGNLHFDKICVDYLLGAPAASLCIKARRQVRARNPSRPGGGGGGDIFWNKILSKVGPTLLKEFCNLSPP